MSEFNFRSLKSYQFELPKGLIAQYPCEPRDHSRLMLIERKTGSIDEIPFHQIGSVLDAEDQLIFNDTKVIPARLEGRRSTGGKVEVLLLKPLVEKRQWEVLVKPARKFVIGTEIIFGEGFSAHVIEERGEGRRILEFNGSNFEGLLLKHGKIPLPPYIRNGQAVDRDSQWYQTVYAKNSGAVAAPTAGLHFTPQLLKSLEEKGVLRISVTLHVGLGTFSPVKNEDITKHVMHSERFLIDQMASNQLNKPSRGKRVSVGTTCCRVLESASDDDGKVKSGEYETDIFIYPGYRFKKVEALLTNFHLPGSTLLMLVSAFAGRDLMMEVYHKAVERKFRFFSYGDAMLIL